MRTRFTAVLLAYLCVPAWASDSGWLTYSPDSLAAGRDAVERQRPEIMPAYRALVEEADEALRAPLYSVVDKTQLPASGDRHDYFSFAPYWWPNPDTEDGLPYVRRDGEYNEATKSDATDKQRMIDFAKDVHALGLAYYYTGQRAYAEKAARQVVNWFVDPDTRMNPNMRYAQAIPGRVDGRDIGIIDSRMLIRVADAIELIRPADVLTASESARIQDWYREFLTWLLTSENGVEEGKADNNHGTWYDAQVVAFALFTGEDGIARRQLQVTRERIAEHFDGQGKQKEELERTRPWHYTNFNLEAYQLLARYGEKLGEDIWGHGAKGRSLREGFEFVADHASKGKDTWSFKELHEFEASDALANMLAAARAYDDPRLDRVASLLARQSPEDINLLLFPPGQRP
ncbi:alginate lyase family protein [Halomonas sp. McH1-25]|uniref:alginate lyase family protein n=1 Tax=unclassified Halomonas TaxID=2609666 RepID=UPI001EF52354|nr:MULTISPECIES: alginate lyase family protein [unclassified Halomonas]MCG7600314.1 alginate lyase family protein [Halomonas sp. McH1-25]MCP1342490.1 alginate lyase family protein [Halomonas sp. FL8]MCP1359573.1 alginate lyase family protein [Halomonas sp. BBD45]MCP1364460.1 alginate lyase family protein [Halomonas sp. BBD48]